MGWPDPITLTGRHVRLLPLAHDHAAALSEAVRDGELWKLWYTSIPEPMAMQREIDGRRQGAGRRDAGMPEAGMRGCAGRLVQVREARHAKPVERNRLHVVLDVGARLRRILGEPASRPATRILARLAEALPALPTDTRLFLELMVRLAPATAIARQLAHHARLRPSTLMSRFSRAGLPSPKTYIAAIRLLYAAQYFEHDGLSITDVAYRLECSSPQSFGRHLRAMLGITPGEFRRRFTFDAAADRFVAALIDPYRLEWQAFRPLEVGRPGRPIGSKNGVPGPGYPVRRVNRDAAGSVC